MYVAEWNQWTLKGDVRAFGAFTYDSMGKKLRFRSNESSPMNTSIGLDLLMFFDEVADFFLSLEVNVHLLLVCFHTLTSESVSKRLPGGVLWDWQQKPELWEEVLAMQPAPSGYSRRRSISCCLQHWESLHRRRGLKSQRVVRVDGRLERWGRRCKIIHMPSFVTKLQNSNLSAFHLTRF